MSRLVIGVDAGGTKTHCALFDPDCGLFDLLTWGQGNHENMPGGFIQLKDELTAMLGTILRRNGLRMEDIRAGAFGMGGVDTKAQHATISGILSDVGVRNFVLSNDAYLGVKAGCASGNGICCINGSGFSVAGIDADGAMLQIGGLGAMTGDDGGGFFFVPEAIRAAYGGLYKGYPPTALTPLLLRKFDIADKVDFLETLCRVRTGDDKGFSLAVSMLLYEAADSGDAAALEILARSGRAYGESVSAVLGNLRFPDGAPVEVTLAGSHFTKQPRSNTVRTLTAYLRKEHPDRTFSFRVLTSPCVLGALLWALEGLADPSAYREQLEKLLGGVFP